MNIFKKIKNEISMFFHNIGQIRVDRENRKRFLAEIQQEILNPGSKYNLFRLNMDPEYKKISCFITIPENYQLAASEAMILSKLKDEARPINEYISRDIAWGEYFMAPEFFYIEDTEDHSTVSCTYIASWNYAPVLDSFPGFWAKFATFITINTLLAIGAIAGIILLFI